MVEWRRRRLIAYVRPLLAALALALASLATLAPSLALADDDRPRGTVAQPVGSPPAAPRKELVLLVGGLDSASSDPAFDTLIARFYGDPRYEIRRFGALPDHPYVTNGSLEANARELTTEVRELSPRYAGIHIVSHSMGGAVVDRAFANGLSADDGVRTYVALAVPHAGSSLAIVGGMLAAASTDQEPEARAMLASTGHDPESPAARELARLGPPAPPRGVTRLDLRLATDALVPAVDATAPGVDSRTLLPRSLRELEGHGAILDDTRALDLVEATIRDGKVPPDDRGRSSRRAADLVNALVVALLIGLCTCAVLTTLLSVRAIAPLRPITRPFVARALSARR